MDGLCGEANIETGIGLDESRLPGVATLTGEGSGEIQAYSGEWRSGSNSVSG